MGAQSAACLLSDCSRPLMRAAAYPERCARRPSSRAGACPAVALPA